MGEHINILLLIFLNHCFLLRRPSTCWRSRGGGCSNIRYKIREGLLQICVPQQERRNYTLAAEEPKSNEVLETSGLRVYNLWAYSLGAYSLGLPDFELCKHSLVWEPTVLGPTIAGPTVSSHQTWS